MNQLQRGSDMVGKFAAGARGKTVCLARYSEADYPNVLANQFTKLTFQQYNERLAGAVARLERSGVNVIVVEVTAEQLRVKMANLFLPKNPDGIAAAVASIIASR